MNGSFTRLKSKPSLNLIVVLWLVLGTSSILTPAPKVHYLVGEVVSVDVKHELLYVRETVQLRKPKTLKFEILPDTVLKEKGKHLLLKDVEDDANVTIKYSVTSKGLFKAREIRVAAK